MLILINDNSKINMKKHIIFECNCKDKKCSTENKIIKVKKVKIEILNFIAGMFLIFSGAVVYFISGFEMMMSWGVFGCMYLAMDKYEEECLGEEELNSSWHKMRRFFAWAGAIGAVVLFTYYITKLF